LVCLVTGQVHPDKVSRKRENERMNKVMLVQSIKLRVVDRAA
jgi:hypothetical protein